LLTRRDQRGGAVKTILIVVVILYAIFATLKVVSARTDDAALRDQAEQKLRYGGGEGMKAKDIHFALAKFARDNNIPLPEDKLIVEESKDEWHIKFDYDRSIDLIVTKYEYPVNFDQRKPKG
jgi:hypothetical protein